MTDASMPVPGGEAVDRWLAVQQEGFVQGLVGALDVEAGLREVLIYAEHGGLVRELGGALDIEAGLAAILPASTSAPTVDESIRHSAQGPHARVLSPTLQERLALRHHPLVVASFVAPLLVRSLVLLGDLKGDGSLARARDVARDLDHARARDVARVLAHDLALARDLDHARDLTYTFTRVLARVLAHDLTLALDADVAHVRAANGAVALARDLNRGLARRDLGRAIDQARTLDRYLTEAVVRLVGLEVAEGIELETLYDLLDDFTQADLSTVDLTGIDLEGIRWSEHTTRWPPGMDVERLRNDSEETPAGSGIYVIRPGTTATDLLRV